MILSTNYNPDVLTCLANLSNDEVFTPPQVVNRMLDMLPAELFRSKETKFLDPVSKSGVFLREIAKRLMIGLESQIPDIHERADHIFTQQLFGIAITELTALTSRRSVYCSKYANGQYSVCRKFKDEDGNLRFKPIEHKFENGKCKYCGASESVFGKKYRKDLESHAYEFIHTDKPDKLFGNMKFDVIIGNPPYQLNVGVEKENYAIPIYHHFVEQAKKLNPRFLTMIVPARWYAGGRGLDDFRNTMLADNRLRVIHDFPDAADCFPGVQIKGGVCYFLWDRDNRGDCKVSTHLNGEVDGPMERPLLEKDSKTFIRYNKSISILHKVYKPGTESFSSLVSPQTPFGLVTSFKGNSKKTSHNDLKLYISGNEKEFKGGAAFVPFAMIKKGNDMIPWHKVYIGKAGSGSDSFPHSILSTPFYGEPYTVCNQTYLVIGPFEDKEQSENAISYIKTRFFRFMVLLKKNSQDAMREVYSFVPLQDFSHPWTDEMLYEKYGLTDEEIAFIESMIRPMD